MKTYKNTLILALVLALLAGVYAGLKYFNSKKSSGETDKEPEAAATETINIFKGNSKDIISIMIENKDGKLVFNKNNDIWIGIAPENFRPDSSLVDSIASKIAGLVADKVIEEEASDLGQYGLDKPAAVITAVYKDGIKSVLAVGNMTPTQEGYYVREQGSSKVYVIGSYTGDVLNSEKNELRDKRLFTLKPEDITGFSMEKNAEKFFEVEKEDKETWKMVFPISHGVNTQRLQSMYNAVLGLEASVFIDSDDGSYGFDRPRYAFDVAGGKETIRLLIGNEKVKGTETYAKIEGQSEVYVVSEMGLDFLDKPVEEVAESFVFIPSIDEVSKVVVEMDGRTTDCEIQRDSSGNSDNDKFSVNGKDASAKDSKGESVFRNYYMALVGITLDSIEPSAKPSGSPEVAITYHLKKHNEKISVEFVSKDKEKYYVFKNGEYSGLTVKKSKFDEPDGVRDSYKKLMEIAK